ncbi:MAG: S41 family peptidase [Actinomycetes bacterium]
MEPSDDPTTGPGTPEPEPLEAQVDRLGRDLATAVSLVFAVGLHLVVGWFHLTVGLIAPLPVALGLQASWLVLAWAIWRFRRAHPLVVLSLPFVSALVWLVVVGLGANVLGWEARAGGAPGTPEAASEPAEPGPATPPDPTSPPTPDAVGPRPRQVVVEGCGPRAGAFALLCEVAELIEEEAFDPPPAASLARAAAGGVPTAGADADAPAQPVSADPVRCAVPSPAWRPVCDAVAIAAVPDGEAVEAAVSALLSQGVDRFSRYADADDVELDEAERSGTVEGIGALVTGTRDPSDPAPAACDPLGPMCAMVITSLLPSAPAVAAGVEVGDQVVAVDGRPVAGRTLDEVTRDVRGPAGTRVELSLRRGGRTVDVTVTRAAVTVPVVESELVEDGADRTAVLALRRFSADAGAQVRAELDDLLDADPDLLVLDLRANPGGSLDATVEVASELLAEGRVLVTRSREGQRPFAVVPGGLATDPALEVVVVVDGGSASASEIVAATLQEAGRATVVGLPTFGKGTVQQRFRLDDGGEATFTVARWETPGGVDVTDRGVVPDVRLELRPDVTPAELVAAVRATLR